MTGPACAVVGLGARGRSFVRRLAGHPDATLAWLVEPRADRLKEGVALAGDIRPRATADLSKALADAALDAVLIATPDHLHASQAIAAFAAGKHVFLEKPMAIKPEDARAVLAARARAGKVLRLGYVLRAARFYVSIRDAVFAGRIGRVLQARLSDDLSARHAASYRRRWHRKVEFSGGLMVHKGCHDLDLVCWLLASRPTKVASFGAADLFARPAPAPFCGGCPEKDRCLYVDDGAYEARTPAEAADPPAYGLGGCVFGQDRALIDRQVVAFELGSGAQGTFALTMGSPRNSDRTIALIGAAGRIDGRFGERCWTLRTAAGESEVWRDDGPRGGHGGGDERTLCDFLTACRDAARLAWTDSVAWTDSEEDEALAGLDFAFAAERARLLGRTIRLRIAHSRSGP